MLLKNYISEIFRRIQFSRIQKSKWYPSNLNSFWLSTVILNQIPDGKFRRMNSIKMLFYAVKNYISERFRKFIFQNSEFEVISKV